MVEFLDDTVKKTGVMILALSSHRLLLFLYQSMTGAFWLQNDKLDKAM